MGSFTKPALSTHQQVDLLIRRGMRVADPSRGRHQLEHINYYRLRAYWLPFEDARSGNGDHRFIPGADLDTVIAIYDFDRRLRLLLMDAIERVEISLRTRLANCLSLRYGPLVLEDTNRFANADEWRRCLDDLAKEYARSRETFAAHYRAQYPALTVPPLWVACELMTLGHLSRWLKNIRVPRDRQAIADAYDLDEKILVSFAHHLTIVRNHCAHHGRLWNRKLSMRMLIPTKKPRNLPEAFNPTRDRYIYNTLTMLSYLMHRISPDSGWMGRLKELLIETPQVDVAAMGFPANWELRTPWLETGR